MKLAELDSKSFSDEEFSGIRQECISSLFSDRLHCEYHTDSFGLKKMVFPSEAGEISTEVTSVCSPEINAPSLSHRGIHAISAAIWLHIMPCLGNKVQTDMIALGESVVNIYKVRRANISVSPRLKVSRENFLKESLLAPSGPYLSWLSMSEGEKDEH